MRPCWSCTGFALYEQGGDGAWRRLRDFTFGGPAVPSQMTSCGARGTQPAR